MAAVIDLLPPKYHDALMAWQRRHFADYPFLQKHWADFYRLPPFELTAKFDDLRSETIDVGEHRGKRRFARTAEMDEETLDHARKIIRAQASTELGSIQQHRESLHKAQDRKMQFDVLRVMAEEFRHGYQMIYLLASDDWAAGGGDFAMQTIEELLEMDTGRHVLDAFNVYFDSFVDNIVFAALIDRVGKYQLTMQKVFAYAPMGRSMSPMLAEEAFHLVAGVGPLKQWVREASVGRGTVSLGNIQRHVNKWLPRALEMFGDERGGETNVRLGLKDMTNREASEKYYSECRAAVIDPLNAELLRARGAEMPLKDLVETARRIEATGETEYGVTADELLRLPAASFFRRRGVHAFEMNDAAGAPVTDVEAYLRHLRERLPEAYVAGPDFSTYGAHLRRHRGGESVEEAPLPFFG